MGVVGFWYDFLLWFAASGLGGTVGDKDFSRCLESVLGLFRVCTAGGWLYAVVWGCSSVAVIVWLLANVAHLTRTLLG